MNECTLWKTIFLSKNQLGFMKGNQMSDAHLILHNLIQLYCHKRGQKVFSCFIDFQKGFR